MADPNGRQSPLAAVEQDIGALMREVAALKHAAGENSRQTRKVQARLLLDVLEVLDAFDRTLALIEPRLAEAEPRARKWVASFGSVRRKLVSQLESHEVVPIEVPDGRIVAGYHRVVDTREQAGAEDGAILEETVKGYLWRGEVLRQSEVVAVKN